MKRSLFYLLSTTMALILSNGTSHAIPLMEMNGGGPGHSWSGGRTVAGDASAAYFNPALLIETRPQSGIGLSSMWPQLRIDLHLRPGGYDVSDSIYRARIMDEQGLRRLNRRPLPTTELVRERAGNKLEEPEHTISVGVVNQLVKNRLHLGISANVPLAVFQAQQPFFIDEREQYFSNSLHFEMFEDRLRTMNVSFGVGIRVLPQLNIGLGATLINHAQTNPNIYIPDAADQSRTLTNANVEIITAFAPHFGLVAKPLGDESLVLTSTVHLAASNRVDGGGELQFWNYDYPDGQNSIEQSFDHAYGYQPLRVSAGLRSIFNGADAKTKFIAHLNGLWTNWSSYRNRQAEHVSDWSDTLSVDGGLNIHLTQRILRIGFSYVPTPIPPQEGRTNYVDNSRLGTNLGLSEIWIFGENELSLTLSTSIQVMLERAHFKQDDDPNAVLDEYPQSVDLNSQETIVDSIGLQTNNPGFPGFESSGFFILTGIHIKWVH